MAVADLFSHTVNVTRRTDEIVSSTALPVNSSVGTTYASQDVQVELKLSAAETASVVVTGRLNGVTTTSTVDFSLSGPTSVASSAHYDYISGISSTLGSSSTISARTISRLGQSVYTETPIFSSLSVRIDKVGAGAGELETPGVIFTNLVTCFTTASEGTIKQGDLVTDTSSSTKYQVKDIDSFYDASSYIYSELLLTKL